MDSFQSFSTIKNAADAGDSEGLYALGNCYAYGNHVPINIRKALELWLDAALQGNASAVFRIGMCYALGTCVPQNTETAVQMWMKSATDGCTEAMHTLGLCHLNGEGVRQNTTYALMWFLLASSRLHTDSREILDELSHSLHEDEFERGMQLMREWVRTPDTVNQRMFPPDCP